MSCNKSDDGSSCSKLQSRKSSSSISSCMDDKGTNYSSKPAGSRRSQGKTNGRSERGLHLIELACSAVALSVMAMFCLDTCIVILGFMFNDAACRDAARAASQAKDSTAALLVAQKTASAHKGDGVFCSTPAISSADVNYVDYGGNITSTNVPYVTVKSTCNIKMPAPILFLGANLKEDGLFQSVCEYTFPITNINLNIPGEAH